MKETLMRFFLIVLVIVGSFLNCEYSYAAINFNYPRIESDRYIDACIPGGDNFSNSGGCSSDARKAIATAFCEDQGFKSSTKSNTYWFGWSDRKPTVYLRLVLSNDLKVVGRSWYNAEGSNVFTDIACE
jgi:hypothetical protein